MDFPLLNAVLAGLPDAQANEASDISGLKAAVQESGLKYKEFDNLDLLPGKQISEVVQAAPKEADVSSMPTPPADPLKNIFSAHQPEPAQGFASFTKPPAPPKAPAPQVKRMEGKNMKQQPLRDVFAFLSGRRVDAQPAASLRDIFR